MYYLFHDLDIVFSVRQFGADILLVKPVVVALSCENLLALLNNLQQYNEWQEIAL